MSPDRRGEQPQLPEPSPERNGSNPPTFAQMLRKGAVNFAKDMRGMGLRLSAYVLEFASVASLAKTAGLDETASTYAALGVMSATMAVGEWYLWDKVSKRLPWFRVRYMENPPKK